MLIEKAWRAVFMRERISIGLSKALCAVLALLFTWAIAAVFIVNYYSYCLPILAVLAAASLFLIVLVWQLIKKHEAPNV